MGPLTVAHSHLMESLSSPGTLPSKCSQFDRRDRGFTEITNRGSEDGKILLDLEGGKPSKSFCKRGRPNKTLPDRIPTGRNELAVQDLFD